MTDLLTELATERGNPLPITTAVNRWRASGEEYTPTAVERVITAMRHDLLSDHRSMSEGRMRPSSIPDPCRRMHALQFAGFEKAPFSERSRGFMDSGTWAHYQWQAMLLSAYELGYGGITDIEVPVRYEPWKLSGSMDGIQPDQSIFELKTVGSFKWSGWKSKGIKGIKDAVEPPLKYTQQVTGYMKSLGVTEASIVCVSRDNNNEFREFRVTWDQAVFDALDRQFTTTMAYVNRGELPPMLESCQWVHYGGSMEGVTTAMRDEWEATFDKCDFHHICPKAVL